MNSQIQRQEQHLKLTPQQLLLIRLLQTPACELEQAVKEEMEKNPMLEDEQMGEQEPSADSESESEEEPEELDFEEREIDPFADEEEEDYRFSDSYGTRQRDEDERDSRETLITSDLSFSAYLLEQLALKPLSERETAIGSEIIGSIDASGYLGRGIDLIANDLAFKQGIDTTPAEVERVLAVVQELDPPGVGARNLRECLSLQLHRMPGADYNAVEIVDHHFDEFTAGRLQPVAERLAMTPRQLEEAVAAIRSLNPKPGSAFGDTKTEAPTVTPDFVVTGHQDGTIDLDMGDSHLPSLRLSRHYSELYRQIQRKAHPSADEQETLRFLRDKADNAQWFISMLDQRRLTLRRIMECIIDFQHDYFLSGSPSDLRPMRLQDIAEPAGYDISTVSRVVNQKRVQTPFGTFLLKELFTYGYTDEQGHTVSTDAVKQALLRIVQAEDKRSPLTDEQLAASLQTQGYHLSRRTIAKYRDSLGIPPHRLRHSL